jgi:succinyl-diaminopimelate desuccinylase
MPTTQSTRVDLISLLRDLIKFPTLSGDPATNKAALDWVKYQLRHLPLFMHDYEHGGHPSLVITTRETKHPKVLLLAHMDVVPAAPEAFTMTKKGGRLYGRGTFDMKLAIAIYMKLLLELGDELPQYDLGVMLSSDEELSGEDGVGYLVAKQGWRADVVLNIDSIGGWQIEERAKGGFRFELTSIGTAAHASRPWMAQNAIQPLMACLQDIAAKFPTEPCKDPQHYHDTINIATIAGGTAINQFPDHAQAQIDIRFMPERDPDHIINLVQSTVDRYPNVSARRFTDTSPIKTDPENEYVRLLDFLISKTAGVQPQHVLSHGSNDNRFFSAHGIPVINTGSPGGGHHSDTEWIEAKGAEQMYRITEQFIRDIGRVL